jgi:hypothetical protein
MLLLRHIPLNTMTALMMFAAMALLLALASGGTIDRMLVRLVIEFPLLMVLAAVFTLFSSIASPPLAAQFSEIRRSPPRQSRRS